MRNFLALTERELKAYFVSPMAYIILGFFVLATGLFFLYIITAFDRASMMAMMQAQQYGRMPALNVNLHALRPLFHNIAIIALFLLPGVTMRAFAEEKRQGTIEFLLTSPLSNWQITLAKFASAALFYLAMLAATAFFISLLFLYGSPELKPLLTGYLGLFLTGACFIAWGLFFSAFTENQIIAFIATLASLLVLLFMSWFEEYAGPTLGKIITGLSPITHFDDFSKGVIDSKHVVFYLSFIFAMLFLTYVKLESERWRGFQGRRIQVALPTTIAALAKTFGKTVDAILEKGRSFGLTSAEQTIADKNAAIELAFQFGYDAEVSTKQ